ncbi:MAG: aminotransferase class III-fold pyridoxal phosphate-dependent enzyme [Solirubrobacteraceae bacterium]|nr:aminotransferase class III-fold pyridoxal phosphate-dependent enzyme [Solirubrobacteraceae bacterium]
MTTTTPKGTLSEIDRRHVFHPFSVLGEHEAHGPRRVIVGGTGSTLTDAEGRTYLDAMAGLWCVNVGYGRVELADALRDQALKLPYYHSFTSMATDTPALLAERILDLAPAGMSKVLYGNSGSDANDTQVKLVRMYNNLLGRPEKKKIISRRRGYHGVTVASGSLTGLPGMHRDFDLPIDGIIHTTPPHRLWEAQPGEDDRAFAKRLADDLDALIRAEGPETVAAFIAEPVQAAGGVIVPPETYWAEIQEVLRRHDVLLIADEVVTGFGRLGTWFGSQKLGIEPDLMTVAKGITSAYVPLSACIVSEKVWRVLADRNGSAAFSHGYTYTSHPLSCACAMANLDVIEKENLLERVETVGAHLQKRLHEAFDGHPLVGEVRGIGLVGAVEFVAAQDPPAKFDPLGSVAAKVTKEALDRGVITRALPEGDTVSFSPPFVVTEAEIDRMVEVVREAADVVAAEVA